MLPWRRFPIVTVPLSDWPGAIATGTVCENVAVPAAAGVSVNEPTNVWPSPEPDGRTSGSRRAARDTGSRRTPSSASRSRSTSRPTRRRGRSSASRWPSESALSIPSPPLSWIELPRTTTPRAAALDAGAAVVRDRVPRRARRRRRRPCRGRRRSRSRRCRRCRAARSRRRRRRSGCATIESFVPPPLITMPSAEVRYVPDCSAWPETTLPVTVTLETGPENWLPIWMPTEFPSAAAPLIVVPMSFPWIVAPATIDVDAEVPVAGDDVARVRVGAADRDRADHVDAVRRCRRRRAARVRADQVPLHERAGGARPACRGSSEPEMTFPGAVPGVEVSPPITVPGEEPSS